MQKYSGNVSIGLISSHLNVEGPIIKDKTSFNISARRTYIDAFLRIADYFMKDDVIPTIYFYDINAKFNHKFSDKSRLYLSIYNGLDKMGSRYKEKEGSILNEKINYGWGNTIASLRWNYVWNPKLFLNITAAYNKYHFDFNTNSTFRSVGSDDFYYQSQNEQYSGIKDWSANADFEYLPNDNHHIRFGAGYIFHTFQPEGQTSRQFQTMEGDTVSNTRYDYLSENMKAHETSLYVEDEISLTDRWKTNIGIHFSSFSIDKKNYWSVQPRLSLGYEASEKLAVKTSYSEMRQYIHLLSSSILSLPTDLWVPVTPTLSPMNARQITLGGFYDTREGYNFSIEGFYKWMDNMLEYKEGAEWSARSKPWYEQVEAGKGNTYGIEFFAQKTTGKLTGWIGYTLAWNNRKFPTINGGKTYPAKYDRRHDIKVNATYRLDEKIEISAAWSFSSGNMYTLALEEYPSLPYPVLLPEHYDNIPNWWNVSNFNREEWIERYEERNNYRIPPTHHLDISLNYYRKKDERGRQGIWNFTIYNVYNQPCPYLIYPGFSEKKGVNVLKQVSLLPILPSVSYTYKF
ncbi:MAG: TonB-dependent receptor [Bacteroidales bacterium]|nr:TonB-dependent receptor [Bacteroidales bacterium]